MKVYGIVYRLSMEGKVECDGTGESLGECVVDDESRRSVMVRMDERGFI